MTNPPTNHLKRLRSLFLLIFVLLILSLPPSASAASLGLSLNPPLVKINIKPGKVISQVFTITNLRDGDSLLVARIVPFTDADTNGNPVLDPQSNPAWLSYFSLANSTIKLGSPFTIKGNSSEQLVLSLNVPEIATLRDLYGTLLISTYSNNLGVEYQGTQIGGTVGANLLVTINPEENPKTILRINRFTLESGSYLKIGSLYIADNLTPVSFRASVSNEGNFAAETKGVFKVISQNETPMYLEGILPVNVIANTQRDLQNDSGENFGYTPGLVQMGLFKGVIQIITGNSSAERSIDIYFFPIKILAGLAFAVTFITIIIRTSINKKPVDTT